MKDTTEKRGRGRPTTHPIEQIDATPEELARAIFESAEDDSEDAAPASDDTVAV